MLVLYYKNQRRISARKILDFFSSVLLGLKQSHQFKEAILYSQSTSTGRRPAILHRFMSTQKPMTGIDSTPITTPVRLFKITIRLHMWARLPEISCLTSGEECASDVVFSSISPAKSDSLVLAVGFLHWGRGELGKGCSSCSCLDFLQILWLHSLQNHAC